MPQEKEEELIIEVEGADQDEALAEAEVQAKQKGYARVSLQNITKITYSARLFDPVKTNKTPK